MTDQLLFNRKVNVLVAAPVPDYKTVGQTVLEITDLRVQFKVSKSLAKEPNRAEVTITNLNPDHRALLQKAGGKFVLKAGYDSGIEQLFIGDVRDVSHVRKGADWETVLKSGDGERAYRFSRISKTFKGGTTVGDVLKQLSAALNLNPGNLDAEAVKMVTQYVQGFSCTGPAQRELDRILRTQGFSWSIQDGAVQVLKNDKTLSLLIPDLSPDTGLIGSPEFGAAEKNKGPLVKATALLQPKIKPGGKVRLRSERFNGDLRVSKVDHEGDTAGGSWYSKFEGEPL